jgi:N-dimethylarginine dimethylaminohydrolase
MIVNRMPRPRSYLMCRPDEFVVAYAINPWMDVDTPVDTALAVKQWDGLRETLVGLGHTVRTLEPLLFLPIHVDLDELKKGGGGIKCCVAELRP